MQSFTSKYKPRCQSLTKKGKQCGYPAAKGEIYCKKVHLNQLGTGSRKRVDSRKSDECRKSDDSQKPDESRKSDDTCNLSNSNQENACDDSQKKDVEKENCCSICLEKIDKSSLMVTKCAHTFHDTCLCEWLKKKENCPYCRIPLEELAAQQRPVRRLNDFQLAFKNQLIELGYCRKELFEVNEDRQIERLLIIERVLRSIH